MGRPGARFRRPPPLGLSRRRGPPLLDCHDAFGRGAALGRESETDPCCLVHMLAGAKLNVTIDCRHATLDDPPARPGSGGGRQGVPQALSLQFVRSFLRHDLLLALLLPLNSAIPEECERSGGGEVGRARVAARGGGRPAGAPQGQGPPPPPPSVSSRSGPTRLSGASWRRCSGGSKGRRIASLSPGPAAAAAPVAAVGRTRWRLQRRRRPRQRRRVHRGAGGPAWRAAEPPPPPPPPGRGAARPPCAP